MFFSCQGAAGKWVSQCFYLADAMALLLGRLGRAECTGKVRERISARLWQSTALPLCVPACLHPRRRKCSGTLWGLNVNAVLRFLSPLKMVRLTWPCDSDLDLAKRVIALRPGLTASVPLAFLPAITLPSSRPSSLSYLEHWVRRPLRSRPESPACSAIEARPGAGDTCFPFTLCPC